MCVTATLTLLSQSTAAASGRSQDSFHPTVMGSSLTPAAQATPVPQREVFGFALASSLADPSIGYPSWNFSLLSTVAFFGLHVNSNGSFAADAQMAVWNSRRLPGLIDAAHPHGTKVVLTIVLQDFSAGTPRMCGGLMNGTSTIARTVAEVKAKRVDGVNVDYEGLNGSCGTRDPSWARHALVNFVHALRAALPAGAYLSVDTYAGSAIDPIGFYDVPGLSRWADSLFVMAYDLEYSNYARAPAGCRTFCLGPTAPAGGYYYSDSDTAAQYKAVMPASKVILGVPYYGRKACVSGAGPNQIPTGPVVADSYLDAAGEAGSNLVKAGSYVVHRDAKDPSGAERWDTWFNTSLKCTRELYWDDTVSLGQKYALVNADNLGGVGIWTLNYGGGAPELWALLNTYFSCSPTTNLAASVSTTEFSFLVTAGSCSVARFEVQQLDSTLNQCWSSVQAVPITGSSARVVADGFRGHAYQFRMRSVSIAGVVGGWTQVGTIVSATAARSMPFVGLYTLDGWGGAHSNQSSPLAAGATWPGWSIARAAKAQPGPSSPQAGFVLDGYGGLHPYGAPVLKETSGPSGHYWPGRDLARDFAFLPDGSGGFVLDAYGGLHSFGINGAAPANTTKLAVTAYWPGWAIARDVVLVPGNGNHSGYVLDGYGGLHPFHPTTDGSSMPPLIRTAYWAGFDIARGLWLMPGSAGAGYTLDGYGGLHPFGGAPAVAGSAYWPGWDIARGIWGA